MIEPHSPEPDPELPRQLADRLKQRLARIDDAAANGPKIVTELDVKALDEKMDALAQAHDVRLAKLYFVYSNKRHSVLHDPMTGKPVSARNPAHLEDIAKQFHGRIVSGEEAVKLLKRHLKIE